MNKIEDHKPFKSILIIIVAGIGDFIESIPALNNIRTSNPDANITLLVSSKAYDYAKLCPYVNSVYSFSVARGRGFTLNGFKSACHYLNMVGELRKNKFDTAINLYEVSTWSGAFRMAFFLKAAGIRTTFGRNTEGKGFFYSYKIDEYSTGGFNQAHYFNALAEIFTGKPVTEKTALWVSAEDETSVSELLNSWNFSQSDKIMLINPGSDRLTRRWQAGYFAEVLDYFALNFNLKPVMVGSANEESLAAEIASLSKAKTYSAAGRLSIGALINLVKRSKILFTTNSAAMHAAGVSGLPFVALAGSGDPLKDRPEGDTSKMSLLWKKIRCNPCDYYKCPEKNYMGCMNVLTPKEVIAEGKRLLEQSSK